MDKEVRHDLLKNSQDQKEKSSQGDQIDWKLKGLLSLKVIDFSLRLFLQFRDANTDTG